MIRVALADDQALVRAGFRALLNAQDDVEVVAEAADGDEAVRVAREHRPDVILMDIRMPGTDGITATETIRARDDAPQIVVLTTFDSDAHVLRALRAGAAGFLLKDTPPEELVVAIRQAAQGRPVLSPEVTRRLIDRVAGAKPGRDVRAEAARRRLDTLGPRERTVAIDVGAGRSNADIAARHHLGLATVKTHVSAILTKLDLDNRVQIALLVHDADLDPQA